VVTIGPSGGFTRLQTFEEFKAKQEVVAQQQRLQEEGRLTHKALLTLLDHRDKELNPASTLELLKLAGGCDPSVQIKADLETDTKHKNLERRLNHYRKAGVVQSQTLRGGISGKATQQVWSLTETGASEVRIALT
jgi:hypothetical protein